MKKIEVFIDSECMMCTKFSDWIIKKCKQVEVFSNSELDERLLKVSRSSIIVMRDDMVYTKSAAIIEILKNYKNMCVRYFFTALSFLMNLISMNFVYDFISKRRLLMFKEKVHCDLGER
jgi:predicted DCC family thiol-disulfide oxidoreductase YuxK